MEFAESVNRRCSINAETVGQPDWSAAANMYKPEPFIQVVRLDRESGRSEVVINTYNRKAAEREAKKLNAVFGDGAIYSVCIEQLKAPVKKESPVWSA